MVVSDVSTASAAVIFRVTLKMTAAEAIETSVTTINSLSQDFTNLDGHMVLVKVEDAYILHSAN